MSIAEDFLIFFQSPLLIIRHFRMNASWVPLFTLSAVLLGRRSRSITRINRPREIDTRGSATGDPLFVSSMLVPYHGLVDRGAWLASFTATGAGSWHFLRISRMAFTF